ncbi:MAG: hypothetical protein DRH08_10745 [Deltaproteobacteria bacterium]|nr:MAG: hypothetical protein DRH08_10745 [Deltaproteobacteria bacterium]
MEYQQALANLLSASLTERCERYVGFALSPKKKTQQKIIKLVYHELEHMLRKDVQVETLPDTVWNTRAYLFCEPRDIGTEFETLSDAMAQIDGNEERLAITRDGEYGCLRTELSGDIYVAIMHHGNSLKANRRT